MSSNNNFLFEDVNDAEESYPEFFYEWDNAVTSGENQGFYGSEEVIEIIEIYFINDEIARAKQAIDYALKVHSDDDDLLYDILLLLNDYELWNDLLVLSERYKNKAGIYGSGHKLTALLHLGMEEEAFLLFRKLKTEYAGDTANLEIIYQAMGESLNEVDLFDSSIDVMKEAIDLLGENFEILWIQIYSYISRHDHEKVLELTDKIQRLNPLDADNWYRLGTVFQDIDEMDKSIEAFEYALSLGYDSQQTLLNLIYAYEKNGNFNKSLEKAKEFLSVDPHSHSVNVMASKICAKTENWEEALKYINEAIKINPDMDFLYLYKSNFLLNMDEYIKAKKALLDGIENTEDPGGDLTKELLRLNEQYPNF